ncbi:transposase [Roseateles sp. DC23W]|uniref:Transposase n=1 Tax=Pelomonas dachongensis TaxID=3299029 RepID=A0ABW7EYM3_9BURK
METRNLSHEAQVVWHICWQAAKSRSLLVNLSVAEMIQTRIRAAHAPPGRQLLYYLLMPSEIHVLSALPEGDSPQLLAREIGSLVSRWVREVDHTRGPVFAARYRAHAVKSSAELKHELRMLAWRPVAVGLCARPSYYLNSSLRATVGMSACHGFEPKALLSRFDSASLEARLAIREVVRGRPPKVELREWELNHGLALATGTIGPQASVAREVADITATLVAAGGDDGIDGAITLLELWVAHKLRIAPGRCLCTLSGPVGVRARALVAGLAVQSKLCSAAAMARRFKRAKATLCEQMAASRASAEDRHLLETPVATILKETMSLGRRRQHVAC